MDASNRKDVRKAEKAAALADRQRVEIVMQVMASPAGRSWFHDILVQAHVFATTFSPDALQMAFAEGQRNLGLQLLNDIMVSCPDQYILMMREANERHARAAEHARSQNGRRDVEGSDEDAGDNWQPGDEHRDGEGNPRFDGYDQGQA